MSWNIPIANVFEALIQHNLIVRSLCIDEIRSENCLMHLFPLLNCVMSEKSTRDTLTTTRVVQTGYRTLLF